ncbi:hypothetical protein Z517_02593 [Fonsecaea pedrosoi CBS 271.37]|uniref:D-isomer specific 2-hydroxyacid dehydrogenase NAD-binding domain-containing protein n=1 Tax=Fonsecaea pedrosoi CBS 271.37 TaxID=1442368 RepID=A0A0D2GQT2_9EURO|nr:uncharacterized protein Z517_02593 [Fonsecaea pedrosoi CBS 271.37]KIW83348.1 hypothetical protein Z517_02593 [Fonsecaea pedrosoi CBS 271.37]
MGGGPEKEHLLIVLWQPEPKDVTAEIQRRFPHFEIKYFQQLPPEGGQIVDKRGQVPQELWQWATILITLSSLPARAEDAPNLKLIHLFMAGFDHYSNHPIVTDSDIPITSSSGIHGPPIAEWIVMTTLVLSRRYATEYEWQKQHHWGTGREMLVDGTDWVGKTVGIAGYGSIGRQAARVFKALGSNIHAYTAGARATPESRKDNGYIVPGTGDPDGTVPRAWYSGTTKESLHAFLSSGLDALVISLPLTPSTRHLFSTREFEILANTTHAADGAPKKSRSAYLINIARGALVDQPALKAALDNGVLLGAALDVTDPEPLPSDDPLWDAKNVIITPHISGHGTEYTLRAFDVFMVNWARHERGEKMFNLLDRHKGY